LSQGGRQPEDVPLATVSRSGHVESRHRGVLVVATASDVVRAFGDPGARVWCRSATKPFQALPLIERGVARRLGFGAAELALACASHNGTPAQVEVVQGMLARAGCSEADLRCGPHPPLDGEAARALAASGAAPGAIHNNCSGKHAGFLALACAMQVAKDRYLDPDGAPQREVRSAVAGMAGLDDGGFDVGLDGCGAPTFRMPLRALAMAFARLANPPPAPSVRGAACRELLAAVGAVPLLYAGAGRLCTALLQALPGAIVPKNGAEGVYAFGLPGRGLGVAIKVSDGSARAYQPVAVAALRALGVLAAVPPQLAEFERLPVRNTQRVLVGHVESVLAW
jgi:L-asparaginase II